MYGGISAKEYGQVGDILEFGGHKVMELDVGVNTFANLRQPRHSLLACINNYTTSTV